MYTAAFRFFDSLSTSQRAKLYQGESIAAMVCAPGSTCSFPTRSGLAGLNLTARQKRLLLKVIANWAGLSDARTTGRELARIEGDLRAERLHRVRLPAGIGRR